MTTKDSPSRSHINRPTTLGIDKNPLRIGLFSDSISLPPKEGISIHVYEFLHYIVKHTDHEIVFFMCDRGFVDHAAFADEPFTTVLIPEKQFFSILHMQRMIRQFGITIAQTHKTYIAASALGEACRREKVPMVSEFHDLEKNVLALYFKELDVEREIKKHVGYQHAAAALSAYVRVMSRYDYDDIAAEWDEFDAHKFIWNPVATPAACADFSLETSRDMLSYIGNLSYLPNKEGADAILAKIAPRLPARQFTFAGRQSEVYQSGNVTGLGLVDDLSGLLSQTALGLSPIFSGSGMKIKNLTYLKHGIPVLTTTVGAQGYPESPAIIIEDKLTEWPLIIERILSNPQMLETLSEQAREVFREYFDERVVNERVLADYQAAIAEYTPPKKLIQKQSQIDPNEMYWMKEFREQDGCTVKSPTVLKPAQAQLIILEGLPGAGKSTALQRLPHDFDVCIVPEMVGRPNFNESTPFVTLDMMKYGRTSAKRLTVMDRSYHSTIAVERSIGGGVKQQATQRAISHALARGHLFEPTLTIYLDISNDLSTTRQNTTNQPFWKRSDVLTITHNYYRETILKDATTFVVDATRPADEVYADIKAIIEREIYQ